MLHTIWVLALVGCASRQPLPARSGASYQVGTVSAVGGTTATDLYTVQTDHRGGRTYVVQTVSANSTWEDAAGPLSFDSATPDVGPAPVRGAYAVSSTPLTVVFGRDGTPSAIADEGAWRSSAEQALVSAQLGDMTSLVDPIGVLRDLARVFPGTPQVAWVRVVKIGGIDMDRVELCTEVTSESETTWRCDGELTLPAGSGAVVHDAESFTIVVVDKNGLVSLEEGWQGTLVHAVDGQPRDEPFGGRRLVTRAEP